MLFSPGQGLAVVCIWGTMLTISVPKINTFVSEFISLIWGGVVCTGASGLVPRGLAPLTHPFLLSSNTISLQTSPTVDCKGAGQSLSEEHHADLNKGRT